MTVITISRQFGSGGDEIAEIISKKIGYRIFDKQLLVKATHEAGLSSQEIVDYSEDHYKAQNFLDRLFGRSRTVVQMSTWVETKDGVRITEQLNVNEEQALGFVHKAIMAAHKMGDMVIVGRGGQAILHDQPDVLHVRVEAPLEERIMRVRSDPEIAKRGYGDAIEARRIAQDLIEKSDIASADYLKRFYNVNWSDSSLYHLIINTGKLHLENAAELIIVLVQQLEKTPEPVP